MIRSYSNVSQLGLTFFLITAMRSIERDLARTNKKSSPIAIGLLKILLKIFILQSDDLSASRTAKIIFTQPHAFEL